MHIRCCMQCLVDNFNRVFRWPQPKDNGIGFLPAAYVQTKQNLLFVKFFLQQSGPHIRNSECRARFHIFIFSFLFFSLQRPGQYHLEFSPREATCRLLFIYLLLNGNGSIPYFFKVVQLFCWNYIYSHSKLVSLKWPEAVLPTTMLPQSFSVAKFPDGLLSNCGFLVEIRQKETDSKQKIRHFF